MNRSGRCFASPSAIGNSTWELMATLPVFTTSNFIDG